MRNFGRTAVVVSCGLLALALVAGAGFPGKAFAHRDCGRACDCCCGTKGCGECGADRGPCGSAHEAASCPDCAKARAKSAPPAMMEGMKAHSEDVRKRVEALRKSEKALAGITDPAAFRAAVTEHLRMVDDLQEAHLRHMESMPGRMAPGERPRGGNPCPQPCPDCPEGTKAGPPAAR